MKQLTISASRSYDVLVGLTLLAAAGGEITARLPAVRSAAIVTDSSVGPLYLAALTESLERAGLHVHPFSFPAGEASKNSANYLALLEFLAECRLTRSDAVLALGGGVVGDLAGFAAATFLRGISLIQIPTTLLAMVDSSVGGKVGINLESGKNLAGAFHQPSLVLCDTDTLQSLPEAAFADGMAEVIKYGMLQSAALLTRLETGGIRDDLAPVILTCIAMKGALVGQDEFDTGQRQLLNFGHTIGHAIERCSGYRISHGRAVAMGMAIITRAAVRQGLCPHECQHRLEALLAQYSLAGEADYSPDALFEAVQHDKKRAGDAITLVLPVTLGRCELKTIPLEEFREWIVRGLFP